MKTVGIVPNYDKEAAMNLVGELAQFLREKDCKVVLTYKIAEVTGLKELGVTKYELFSKSDFIMRSSELQLQLQSLPVSFRYLHQSRNEQIS